MTGTLTPPLDGDGCPSGLEPPVVSGGGDVSAFVRKNGQNRSLDLAVRGAKCAGCLTKIESAVGALPGIQTARLNLSTGRMSVAWTGALPANRIADTIASLGYGVAAYDTETENSAAKQEERRLLIAMGVAGFAAANIMLLSISVWGGAGEMGEMTRRTMHAISGAIALPAVIFSGRHFFNSAWNALRNRHVNMDVPISLAVILAFTTSVWETMAGGPHAYFDACVMLLFFLLIGRFLDARLRRQAYGAAHELAALQSRSATRIDTAGTATAVRADDIVAGDTILLSSGERAVVDMQITSGTSEIDESLVSGESLPSLAAPGTKLFAGSVNLGQPLTGKATAGAADSLLSDIARMLDAGEQRKSGYRKIADRAVALYVPFVHTTALLAFLGWFFATGDVRASIMIAVSTLIITCPCALALAAPVVQVVASGRLFKSGVYLKSGDALERLAGVDHVVFDKTGTLTIGEPILIQDDIDTGTLAAAANLARASRHPLSRALVAAAGPGPVAVNVIEHPGLGLEAVMEGQSCRLGSAEWVGATLPAHGDGPSIWYAAGDAEPVQFKFIDAPRPDAANTLSHLGARGLTMEILSGDKAPAVAALSATLGVSNWTAEATPQGKVDHLEHLRAQGKHVLMIGDGLNDAGALSLAHASLAPGGAMDVSQAASDAVFSGGLNAIPEILDASKAARRAMLQNFALAAAYNLIAVPIAVTGHVTPLIAAIAMSASSLIVTLNALRIARPRRPA